MSERSTSTALGHALAQGLLHAVVEVGVGRGAAYGKAHLGVLLDDGGDELDLGAMAVLAQPFRVREAVGFLGHSNHLPPSMMT